MQDVDDDFYDRADEPINLSNQQVSSQGVVNTSMLFSVVRYNAYISALGCESSNELRDTKPKAIEYFVAEYKKMKENIDNFGQFMNPSH